MGFDLPSVNKGMPYYYNPGIGQNNPKEVPGAGISYGGPETITDRYIPSERSSSQYPEESYGKAAAQIFHSPLATTDRGRESGIENTVGQPWHDVKSGKGSPATDTVECKTCNERKYKDGSNDPGVSFKYAAHVSPNAAANAVIAHESQHVAREQVKAKSEDRTVAMQYVRIHSAICPECGRIYVSGGTTTTATKSKPQTPCAGNLPDNINKNNCKTIDIKV